MSEENTPPVVQPEFPAVTEACPPGPNFETTGVLEAALAAAIAAGPVKVKRPMKAVAKLYFVTQGPQSCGDDSHALSFNIVDGSEEGFRTWEEMAKFIRTLPPGKYTPITASSKSIEIVETTTTKIKGL
jgi:hypothetical protein